MSSLDASLLEISVSKNSGCWGEDDFLISITLFVMGIDKFRVWIFLLKLLELLDVCGECDSFCHFYTSMPMKIDWMINFVLAVSVIISFLPFFNVSFNIRHKINKVKRPKINVAPSLTSAARPVILYQTRRMAGRVGGKYALFALSFLRNHCFYYNFYIY